MQLSSKVFFFFFFFFLSHLEVETEHQLSFKDAQFTGKKDLSNCHS